MKYLALAIIAGLSASSLAQYSVFASETFPGSLGSNTSSYGGVQRYDFASAGGAATPGTGISAGSLSDPSGLRFRNGNLYVSNRHGNTLGQGSIQSFAWDGANLSGGATLATASSASFQGFHGLDVAPNGDLFVSTVNGGTRRYRDSGSGYVDIGGVASGAVRDVWISPDGNKMYESALNGTLRVTDVLANGFGSTTSFAVSGSNTIHQMTFMGGDLYVASFDSGTVHRVDLDANYQATSSSTIASYSGAIGLAFSTDGQEMYVASHTGNSIGRFLANGGAWDANGSIATGEAMGYLATVPEPGTMAALALGVLGLAKRRRSR